MGQAKSIVDRTVRDIETTMSRLKQIFGTGLVAGAFDYVAKQAMEAEQAVNRLDAVIRATGNASGYTKQQLHGMADAMAEVTQFDDEDIRNATASLLKFGNIHGKVLKDALKLSADYAAFTGTNMASAAETLGKAIASPAQGVERLQRAIGYLNPAQVETIKRMQEMGDIAGAQATLMQILTQKIGGVADAMNTGYTKAFGDAKKASGEFFEALGNSTPVQATVQSFLGFVTQSMRDMKHIIEDGDWVQALKFIMGFRQTDAQAAARRPAEALGAGSGTAQQQAELESRRQFNAQLAEQDERAIREMLARQKKANEERTRDAYETAQLIQRGDEESAKEAAEAWQYWDKYVLEEERKATAERIALGEAYVREQEMAAEDVTEAWIYYNKFLIEQDRKRAEEARATWGGFIDGIDSAFRDSWNTIGRSWEDALDSMKNAFQRILLDFIYQSLAKPFVLSVVANLASSASMSGLASVATSAAGSGSLASGAMSAAESMGPVGWAALAVSAVAAVAYAFRDKGENWRAQFGFGANAMQPYSTQGVFGTEGFAQIQGQDAFARAMQEFMAGTRELDQVLARHLSADSIDRIVASLAGPYATRADGQPSEFAFGSGQEAEAAAQLTLEYLQKKYGTVFDEIDATFADFIRAYTGTSEELLAEIGAFAQILNGLSTSGINGLDVEALRAMQREGEALADTFTRVSGEMSTMRENFLTDAEKLNLAQEALSGLFGDMALLGMQAPADNAAWLAVFESLDLATEAGREMHDRMVALAPAFLAVGDAAAQAAADATAAAATMLASFDSVMGQLRGSPYTRGIMQGQLDAALGTFQSGNAWSQGMSLDALMGQLLTITREDFQNYGADMQGLITQILTLYSSLQSLTDPISTVATTVGTILAPAIDTAAIASDHLNSKLALLAQIYELNGDAVSAAAIKEHQRAIALEEIRRQDAAAGTIGELEGLTTTLWALQDAAAAAAEEEARAAEVAREQEEAARGVLAVMQEIVRAMDQVAAFKGSVGNSIQSIRSGMSGFDAVGYQTGQVGAARIALAAATDIEGKLAAGGSLRDAIMGRYQAEVDAINATHQAQSDAGRAAVESANQLNAAFRSLGDYAKSLLTGSLSALSPEQKLAESSSQYRAILARARGGDVGALGQLQGAASGYLEQARGFYASSDSYVRIFGEVQGALADLGARAGPEQVYQENTAAWQASLLEIQMRAIDELTSLESLTDAWQQELQEQLVEQAIVFSQIGLSTAQIAENTKDLDTRIASAINTAVAAAVRANGEIAQVQMDRDDEWYERQYDATKKLPGQLATAVTVTDRR